MRPKLALLLLAAAAQARAAPSALDDKPVVAAARELRSPVAETATLPGGTRLVIVRRQHVPLVVLSALIQAGSELDPPAQPGLAALVARVVEEGGAGARDAQQRREALAALGAELQSEVLPSGVRFSVAVESSRALAAHEILADIVTRPRFDESDFAGARRRQVAELMRRQDEPQQVADAAFLRALYGAHPYGHDADGEAEAVGRITLDDVRRFHAQRWGQRTLTVVAVGDIDATALRAAVDKRYGAWAPAVSRPPKPPAPAHVPSRVILIDKPGAPQSEVRVGHVGADYGDADLPAIELVEMALGGSFTSRLVQNLRERHGYCYNIQAKWELWRAPGPFAVQVALRTDATAAGIKEILDELVGMQRPMEAAELDKSRALLRQKYVEFWSDAESTTRFQTELMLQDQPSDLLQKLWPAVAALDGAKLTEATRRIVRPAEAVIVIVGDRRAVEAGLKTLARPLEIAPARR